MIFQAPAILTRISSLKDNGLALGFHTNELSTQDKVIAFSFYQQWGFVLFKENEFQPEEIPTADVDESRSPSQRLRNVLFVWWKLLQEEAARSTGTNGGEKNEDFERFYRRKMELIIDQVKTKLK